MASSAHAKEEGTPRAAHLVVISGVTSGIGRALFREFAKLPGFRVAGCGRRRDRLDQLAEEVGAPHLTHLVDVGDDAAVQTWAADVLRTHGAPPLLVIANAGIALKEASCAAWAIPDAALEVRRSVEKEFTIIDQHSNQAMLRVNVLGVASLARHFLGPMVAAQDAKSRGAFVSISSGSGRSTGARKGAYASSKFAVEAYTKCVAHALEAPLIAVPLAPGTLRTELNAKAPGATADEWAIDAVPFLLDLLDRPWADVNGASLSVPGYYAAGYKATWIIKDGQPLLSEATGAARHSLDTSSPSSRLFDFERAKAVLTTPTTLAGVVAACGLVASLALRRRASS